MKYSLYVIYDTVAKESGFPFDAKNDGVAIRKFQNFLREVEKNGSISDIEFQLRKVCEYDSESCEISSVAVQDIDLLSVDLKKEE